jgi:hypothetical protein
MSTCDRSPLFGSSAPPALSPFPQRVYRVGVNDHVTIPNVSQSDLLSRRRAPERRIDNALQVPSLASSAWRREFCFGVAAELHGLEAFGSRQRGVAYLDLLAFRACLDRPMYGSVKRVSSHGRHSEQQSGAFGRVGKVARVVPVQSVVPVLSLSIRLSSSGMSIALMHHEGARDLGTGEAGGERREPSAGNATVP